MVRSRVKGGDGQVKRQGREVNEKWEIGIRVTKRTSGGSIEPPQFSGGLEIKRHYIYNIVAVIFNRHYTCKMKMNLILILFYIFNILYIN